MHRKFCKYIKKSDNGFTFVEVLAAVIILTVLGVVIWQGFLSALTGIDGIGVEITECTKILQIDDTVREAASRIIVPFWLNTAPVEKEINLMRIPYIDSCSDKELIISFEKEVLTIETDGNTISFSAIDNVEMDFLTDDNNSIYGILLNINYSNEKFTIEAPFGGLPVQGNN